MQGQYHDYQAAPSLPAQVAVRLREAEAEAEAEEEAGVAKLEPSLIRQAEEMVMGMVVAKEDEGAELQLGVLKCLHHLNCPHQLGRLGTVGGGWVVRGGVGGGIAGISPSLQEVTVDIGGMRLVCVYDACVCMMHACVCMMHASVACMYRHTHLSANVHTRMLALTCTCTVKRGGASKVEPARDSERGPASEV